MDAFQFFNTSSVLSEASKNVQKWLETIITDVPLVPEELGSGIALPWSPVSDEETPWEGIFREHILRIAQNHNDFLVNLPEAEDVDMSSAIGATAGAVLEVDAALRQLRFRLVPKTITEETFWRRYFGAVVRAKATARRTETVCDSEGLVLVAPDPGIGGAGIGMLTGSCQEASGKVAQTMQQDTCLMAQRPHGKLRTRYSMLSQASSIAESEGTPEPMLTSPASFRSEHTAGILTPPSRYTRRLDTTPPGRSPCVNSTDGRFPPQTNDSGERRVMARWGSGQGPVQGLATLTGKPMVVRSSGLASSQRSAMECSVSSQTAPPLDPCPRPFGRGAVVWETQSDAGSRGLGRKQGVYVADAQGDCTDTTSLVSESCAMGLNSTDLGGGVAEVRGAVGSQLEASGAQQGPACTDRVYSAGEDVGAQCKGAMPLMWGDGRFNGSPSASTFDDESEENPDDDWMLL